MKKEKLSMDELDGVAGGTIIESYHIGFMLQDAGYNVFDNGGKSLNFDKFRSVLKGMGFDNIEDHGGIFEANKYTKGGQTMGNVELINFLVKEKGCVDKGVPEYTKRYLELITK